MTHPALKMYNYHVWANGVIMDRLKELPQDIYHKEIQSGFSSVSKVLSHMYVAEYGWFEMISGKKSMNETLACADQLMEQVGMKNIEEMQALFLELADQYNEFLGHPENIEKALVIDNPYAGMLETSVSDTVLHVVTHGSYHRGNIATMLRQVGYTSVMQDYGLYLYRSNKT
ncbi:DinB family protein [Caldalkalibacillus mannanilyticus]|uniref:DinB family protein n=1 Tax=Caldalkalibacillus mannanilyticus TaxID=1418 RepID=UPI00046A7D04|nr:DinB family protein [Caldalkalibacillus mannanilyticus]